MDSVMLFVCPQLLLQHYCYCCLLDCCRFQVPTSTGAQPPLPTARSRALKKNVSSTEEESFKYTFIPRDKYKDSSIAATPAEAEPLLKPDN